MKKYLFIALAISATAQAEPTAKTFEYQYTEGVKLVLTAEDCVTYKTVHPTWIAYAENDKQERAEGCWTHGMVIPNMPQVIEIHLEHEGNFFDYTLYKDKFEARF